MIAMDSHIFTGYYTIITPKTKFLNSRKRVPFFCEVKIGKETGNFKGYMHEGNVSIPIQGKATIDELSIIQEVEFKTLPLPDKKKLPRNIPEKRRFKSRLEDSWFSGKVQGHGNNYYSVFFRFLIQPLPDINP